jgi:hypothetical protein
MRSGVALWYKILYIAKELSTMDVITCFLITSHRNLQWTDSNHTHRFEKFWHFPLGHVLCYGVCKPFFKLVLSTRSKQSEWAWNVLIPAAEQRKMAARVRCMRSTACISCRLPDIVRCAYD